MSGPRPAGASSAFPGRPPASRPVLSPPGREAVPVVARAAG